MHSAKAGQRMADQSRHGVVERDIEQVDSATVMHTFKKCEDY
jgi:hypothetical protein